MTLTPPVGWNEVRFAELSVFPYSCSVLFHFAVHVIYHKWLASQKICSVEELEMLPAGTKPRTSYR